MKASRSAIFLSPTGTHHADRCEPLVQAVRRGEVNITALARRGYPGRALPPRMLPEISTVGYWDASGPQSWGLDWHRNEGVELTFVSRGKTDFLVEDQSFQLDGGQLTITRPWQYHRLGNPHVGATRLHWLILDVGVRRPNQPWRWPDWFVLSPADLGRLTTLLSHNEQPVWQANAEIGGCFERLSALVRQHDPAAAQSRFRLLINELFLAVLDLLERKNVRLDAHLVSTRRTVEIFLSALPEHLETAWTLGEMAERCGLGRSRFADYCRHIVNMAPADYLIHCRVEAAKKLLRCKPAVSITDIAFRCGFETSQYFATAFRKRTGRSPREYRLGTRKSA